MLAYATTVHKAQGSEYPVVVIPLMTQHYAMLQRNLLYTAVTRGRRLVILLGQQRPLRLPCAMFPAGADGPNSANGFRGKQNHRAAVECSKREPACFEAVSDPPDILDFTEN